MGTVVVDAGVLIGWLDRSDPHHESAHESLEAHSTAELCVPASALAEVLVGHVRRGTIESVRSILEQAGIQCGTLGADAAVAAAELRARHRSLRLHDALVLGYASAVGAEEILTTDRRLGRLGGGVVVIG